MASPILPFAIGAFATRNKIADDQDRLTGEIVDTVAQNYFAQSSDEKNRLKKVDKVYDNLTNLYPVQAVEAFAHAGLITDDMKETLSIIQNTVKPEAIENLKNLKPEDLKFVFKNNNSAMVEATSSKENTVASNLNRGQLKNLSDLYFGKEIKEGKLDTARNFMFGGPVIKDKDVAPAILQLERETDKIQPDLEKADNNILEAFTNIPGGPLITAGGGSGTGISDSQFRLRSNDAIDATMSSLGLGGKYTRDAATGNVTSSTLSDLEGSKFAYINELVSLSFNQPNFNLDTYVEVGPQIANIVKDNDRLISKSIKTFKASAGNTSIMPKIDTEVDGKKKNVFNQAGYDIFTASNVELIARFMTSKSAIYREYIMSNFGYREYWNKVLEDAVPSD